MRRIISRSLAAVAIAGTLSGACSVPALAADESMVDRRASARAEAPAAASADAGVTVGHARNQATGDVLGLGYEQVIRFDGPDVIITEPVTKGGAELRRFPAQASSSWPEWTWENDPHFTGQDDLVHFVRHEASRIAVLGDHVYVSRLLKQDGVWGAEVAKYRADGVQETTRWISGAAVTALDGIEHDGREYLAVGLNQYGVRVLRADEAGLPAFRDVHTDWDGNWIPLTRYDRDQVTAVGLGTDAAGRLLLVSGRLTYKAPAIVVTDLRVGEPSGTEAAKVWEHNALGYPKSSKRYDASWEFPDLIDVGPLGIDGRPLVAVSWPRTGRVSFVDAETGAEWLSRSASTGAHALRFLTGGDGVGYVLIVRDAANGTESFEIATTGADGEWLTVHGGAKADLPAALAELAGA